MEISIGSYKMRVEILLLIIVLFWVAFGHLLCGCCKVSLFEGATTMQFETIEEAQRALNAAKRTLGIQKSEVSRTEFELDNEKNNVKIAEKNVVKAEQKLIELKSKFKIE